jgi:hypothetical protein
MIWRKRAGATPADASDGGRFVHAGLSPSPPMVLAGGSPQTLYRQLATTVASSPAHEEAEVSNALADASAASSAGEVNLEEITEHVSRAILRRLAVERERRGIRRWL